jgi:protein-S-isoprenylcysteine O-methyltransferase Ste14
LLLLLAVKPHGALLIASSGLELAGIILFLFGFFILLVAYFNLKPSLRVSPIPIPGAPLITRGIYNYFRHPMYLAVLFIGAGMVLRNLDIAALFAWSALFITLCVKANMEDGLLRKAHPGALEYQNRVIGMPWFKNA